MDHIPPEDSPELTEEFIDHLDEYPDRAIKVIQNEMYAMYAVLADQFGEDISPHLPSRCTFAFLSRITAVLIMLHNHLGTNPVTKEPPQSFFEVMSKFFEENPDLLEPEWELQEFLLEDDSGYEPPKVH